MLGNPSRFTVLEPRVGSSSRPRSSASSLSLYDIAEPQIYGITKRGLIRDDLIRELAKSECEP